MLEGGLYKGVKLTHCWQMSKMLFPPFFGPIWFCKRKKDTTRIHHSLRFMSHLQRGWPIATVRGNTVHSSKVGIELNLILAWFLSPVWFCKRKKDTHEHTIHYCSSPIIRYVVLMQPLTLKSLGVGGTWTHFHIHMSKPFYEGCIWFFDRKIHHTLRFMSHLTV